MIRYEATSSTQADLLHRPVDKRSHDAAGTLSLTPRSMEGLRAVLRHKHDAQRESCADSKIFQQWSHHTEPSVKGHVDHERRFTQGLESPTQRSSYHPKLHAGKYANQNNTPCTGASLPPAKLLVIAPETTPSVSCTKHPLD